MRTPVYMDHHATTPLDPQVLAAMMPYFTEQFGNPASLFHRSGWIAREAVEQARKKVAAAINARPREIIFTSGATEANNLAIKGIAAAYRSKGNHIITAATEHQCVLASCRHLEREGFRITVLPVERDGSIDLSALEAAIGPDTILVSLMTANNEIGTIHPVAEIGRICRSHGVLFHTDATQAVGRIPVDVEAMQIDLLSFSAHKLYGPKGTGVLYLRSKDPIVTVEPQMDGAGHEHGMRSGTLNVPGIVGCAKAVQIAVETMDEETRRTASLRDVLQEGLLTIAGATVNGKSGMRLPNNLSMTFPGVRAETLMNAMTDIAVSAGAACTTEEADGARTSHVLRAIGLSDDEAVSTVRFGLGRTTTADDVRHVISRFTETVAAMRETTYAGAP